MMNNEIKMPASFAAIDENEMVYLQGGATTEATAWDVFLNVGKLFNYIARVFGPKPNQHSQGIRSGRRGCSFLLHRAGRHSPPNAGKQPFFCKAGGLSIDKAQEGVVY